jgi:uracil-DNA glycosylase
VDSQRQQSLFEMLDRVSAPGESPPEPESPLEQLRQSCLACSACGLRNGCRQVVFARGNPQARVMLIGEGPGADEDRLGAPFVGAAGQLLNRILDAAGFGQDELYITNVVKCRPPGNRLPVDSEVKQCLPYLKDQIELVNPAVIVCLGAVAARTLIDSSASITRIRGHWIMIDGRRYMPTFHPAALLRDAGKKRPVWQDFQEIAQYYRSLEIGDGGI